jgi:hypothetical protein
LAKAPLNAPTAVRAAEAMTMSVIGHSRNERRKNAIGDAASGLPDMPQDLSMDAGGSLTP